MRHSPGHRRALDIMTRSKGGCMIEALRSRIREVPGFPEEGILFYDITTVLLDAALLRGAIELMASPYELDNIDVVCAMESRGFIFGAPIALQLNAGFSPIRKLGKLPADRITREY